MFVPPFCPNKDCAQHFEGVHPAHWYRRYGAHATRAFGRVQRYICTCCGKTFSTQTFSLDYYAKRVIDYQEIFRQIRSTAGIRDLSRNLVISRDSAENRLFRLSHWALAVHVYARQSQHLEEDLVADGFEGYLHSKYFPHHLNILIGKRTQYFYAMDFTSLRRKGRMTSAQQIYRDYLDTVWRPDPKGIEKSMCRLAEEMLQLFCRRRKSIITLYTDDHQAYPRALQRHPIFPHLLSGRVFYHHSEKGTKVPFRSNRLFAVNYVDRQLRKDIVNYVRETVNTARNVNSLLERLCVYRLHHNYVKPFRANTPKEERTTHGELAGCDMKKIAYLLQWKRLERPFASLLSLTPGEMRIWFRRYPTPLKWIPDYLPKYANG
jgi:hypothetical protein